MMFKRKFFSVFVFALLISMLPGCTKSDNTKDKVSFETEGESLTEVKTVEKADNKDDKKETKDEVKDFPHILLSELERTRMNRSKGNSVYTGKTVYLQLKDDSSGFNSLKKALDRYNDEADKELDNALREMNEQSQEILEGDEDFFEHVSFSDITSAVPIRADKNMVSILRYRVTYYGGMTPGLNYSSKNYDTNTGEELNFTDVVKDQDKFFDLVDAEIKESYPDNDFEFISEYISDAKNSNYRNLIWTANGEGVSVYFNFYELGAYFEGAPVVTVYYDENKEIFEDKYVNKEDDYVIPLLSDLVSLDIDTDNDGKREKVKVESAYSDEGYSSGMNILVGNSRVLEIPGRVGNAYIVKKDGKYYMYMFMGDENEGKDLYRVDLSTLEYDEKEVLPIGLWEKQTISDEIGDENIYEVLYETFTDINSFLVESSGHVLCYIESEREWHVGKDGLPKPTDTRYKVSNTNVIHSIKDYECEEIDEEGNVKGRVTLPEDSYLLFMYTDNENWVDVRIVDKKDVESEEFDNDSLKYFSLKDESLKDYKGDCYRITPDAGEDVVSPKINGENANKYFEGIVFFE